ncbi:MAG TPA: pitrilysin family protein [Woeseiaceae bacterium]|jgi:predicted Zn-dependent peptidase|nr:pitrilysin family protein [Woeseiaceae bacterium]
MKRVLLTAALACCALAGQAAAQGVTLPAVERVELDNGVVLLVTEQRDVPLVGLEVIVRGGAITDPDGKAGLASLMLGLMEKGAGSRNADAFAEAVDGVGGSLTTSAGLETLNISAEFLSRDTGLMVELVADMLQAPRFDGEELRKLRDRRIDLLRAAKDRDPRELSPLYGNAFLFTGHPYGRPVNGDETSLASLRASDVRGYYEDFVGANRLVIAAVGDFDAADMISLLTLAFADWRTVEGPLPEVPAAPPEDGRRVLLVDKPGATQSYFWIGNIGVSRSYPQRAELDIANTLFGGRFTSLLVDELRTKAGLTYSAYSALLRPSAPGSVAVVSYTKTSSTIEAIDLALGLLGRLHETGFDPELIASGKNYILGQFPPGYETAAQLAEQFANLEAFGLGAGYVNDYGAAVAAADVEAIQAVIDAVYPRQDDLVFVIIGDAETIRDSVAKYGPITEMALTDPRFSP